MITAYSNIQAIEPCDLLNVHAYSRRELMGRGAHLQFEHGKVIVRWYNKPKPRTYGVLDFIWNLVGHDGNICRVNYYGAYKGTSSKRRHLKVDDFSVALAGQERDEAGSVIRGYMRESSQESII